MSGAVEDQPELREVWFTETKLDRPKMLRWPQNKAKTKRAVELLAGDGLY